VRHYGRNWYVANTMREYADEKEHYDLPLEIEPDYVIFTFAQIGLLDEARKYFELSKHMKS